MRTSLAIIGAGFSGTLTAIHLARTPANDAPIDIYLIDPRGSFGPGLAYSPPSERFKLNVRAQAMGAFPDDVEGFYRWAKKRYPNTSPDDFSPRLHYGEYLSELLNEAAAQAHGNTLHRLTDEVVGVSRNPTSGKWAISLKSGDALSVDGCVIAIGNLMSASTTSAQSTTRFREPYNPKSYDDVSTFQTLFILGSGLTAVDTILECEARGFHGTYTVLSRHGRFPRPHESLPSSAIAHLPQDWDTRGSARALVSTIRAESRRLGSSQPVFDAMRPKIQSMWRHLSLSERKRFLRHVRPVWDIHRHRIPSEHGTMIEELRSSGRLNLMAGRLISCDLESSRIAVAIRKKGDRNETTPRLLFDAAFRCTGPEADITKTNVPVLQSLRAHGLISPGPLGLSPRATREAAASLWLLGPLQREDLWEITAVREIRQQAQEVAAEIQHVLKQHPNTSNQ
jgi:uncharacterized NAD(P)/FAD-binding protein YdhS